MAMEFDAAAVPASSGAQPNDRTATLVADTTTTQSSTPHTVTIALEAGDIVHLPAGTDISHMVQVGNDLEFIQPDGTVIVIPNGAVTDLTVFVGNVEIPADTVAALYQSNNIHPAEGPAGGQGGGHEFNDPGPHGIGNAFGLTPLLGPNSLSFESNDVKTLEESDFIPKWGTSPVLLLDVSEEGLGSGNPDTNPDPGVVDTTNLTVRTGSLGVTDQDNDFLTFKLTAPSSPLTSDGHLITWTETSSAGSEILLGTDSVTNQDVIKLIVINARPTDGGGNYTLELFQAIDHPVKGQEDDLQISLGATVTDHKSAPVAATIVLTVEDDSPVVATQEAGQNLIVNGDFVDGFALFGNWGNGSGVATDTADTGTTGGWTITREPGSTGPNTLERVGDGYDGEHSSTGGFMVDLEATPGNIQISQTIAGMASGQDYVLTFEAGEPVNLAAGSAVLDVYFGGQLIDTITPTGTMTAYSYTLQGGLGDGSNELTFKEVGSSGDNSGTYLANVELRDAGSFVDEDGLYNGLPGGPGDVPGVSTVATEALNIKWGADNFDTADSNGIQDGANSVGGLTGRALYFTDDTVTASLGSTAVTLHSAGQAVQYELVANGTELVGYTGTFDASNQSNWVFTATLSDDDTGSYTFTLLKPLDHPIVNTEDNLALSFNITARDSDGDTAATGFTVSVNDDSPTVTASVAALADGLDFGSFTPNNNEWGQGSGTATGTNGGWTIAGSETDNTAGGAVQLSNAGGGTIQLERVGDGYDGMHSSTHGYMVDLDASPHDVEISQKITGLSTGEQTVLHFEAGVPVGGTGTLEVLFGGQVIQTINPTNAMTGYSITLTGGFGDHSDLLEFREVGTPDNVGTYLANVSVGGIIIDETPGIQGDSSEVDSLASIFGTIVTPGTDLPTPQYAQGSSPAVAVDAQYGADGPGANALVYALSTTDGVDSGLETTDGTHIYLYNEGNFVVGRYESDGHSGISTADKAAFAFQLDPTTGVISMVQYVSLHHGDTTNPNDMVQLDAGTLNVKVTVTDGDGDTAQTTVDVSKEIGFRDDGPTLVSGQQEAGTVNEDDIFDFWTQGTSPDWFGRTDLLGAAHTSGSLSGLVNFGADGLGSFSFTTDAKTQLEALHLTSNGHSLSYTILNGVLVGYVDNGQPGPSLDDRPVFTLTLIPNGRYDFELFSQLDHDRPASGEDTNTTLQDNGQNSTTDAIDFGQIIQASDGDGDHVTLDGAFSITVTDDIPKVIQGAQVHGVVEEEELPGGNEDTSGGSASYSDSDSNLFGFWDNTRQTASGSGFSSLAALVDPGADGGKFSFVSQVVGLDVATDGGSSVLSHGGTVSVTGVAGGADSGGHYEVLTAGTTGNGAHEVFTLKVYDNGDWTFTLKAPLDDLPGDNAEGVEKLNLSGLLQFTDYDGDTVGLGGSSFVVGVIDDVPTVSIRGVSAGPALETYDAGTDDGGHSTVSASFATAFAVTPHYGADGPGTTSTAYSLEIAAHPDRHGRVDSKLDHDGQAIYLYENAQGVIVGSTALSLGDVTAANTAFTVAVDSTGSVTLTQYESIDHGHPGATPGPYDSQVEILASKLISLVATATITDYDGDRSTNSASIDLGGNIQFADDGPAITTADIQNGAVDEDALGGNAGDSYPETSVPLELSGVLHNTSNTFGTAGDIDATDTAHGSLGVNWGADDGTARTLTFDNSALPTGLKSGGADVHFWMSADHATVEAYTGSISSSEPTDPVFTVTLDASAANGAYTFVLHHPLDEPVANQEDSIDLSFGFIAKDSDGDQAKSSFTVTVNDDAPVAHYLGLAAIQESADADGVFVPVTRAGTLPYSVGADGGSITHLSYRFAGASNVVADGDASGWHTVPMTSDGQPVSIYTDTSVTGHITLIGYTGSDKSANHIFTFDVNQATGAYTYTQSGPLDHPDAGADGSQTGSNDPVVLTFDYIVTDKDGDNATNAVNVAIDDSGPSIAAAADAVTVSEDGLDDANKTGGSYDAPVKVADASGSLHVDFGADDGVQSASSAGFGKALAFNLSQDGVPLDQNGTALALTSGGVALTYTVTSNASGVETLTAAASGHTVFTVTLDPTTSNGSYAFDLVGPLDHIPAANTDALALNFGITASDADHDTVQQNFTVTVQDDTPVIGTTTVPAWFSDDFDSGIWTTSGGYFDGVGNGYGTVQTYASGSNGITTKSGSGNYAVLGQTGTLHNDATGPYTRFDDYKKDFLGGYVAKVDVHIDPASWGVNNGFDYSVAAQQQDGTFLRDFIFHLTSDGTTVHVGASNNSGDQDGPESPAQIDSGTHSTISTSGWYTLEQVFHQGSDGALAVDLVVLDAAGTTVFTQTLSDSGDLVSNVAGGNLYGWFTTITVPGGLPVDNVSLSSLDGVAEVNEDDLATIGTVGTPEPVTVTGQFHISWGADDGSNRSLAFGAAATQPGGLTSHGVAVSYWISSDGTELVAYRGTGATGEPAAADQVFTITLDDSGTGSYTFTLLSSLDHPAGNGQNDLPLNFGFVATDSDGDSASSSFTVNVHDDVPVVAAATNLIVNGSFELNDGSLQDGQWGLYHHIAGWDAVAGNNGVVPFEIQDGNVGGTGPEDGHTKVELDSDLTGANSAFGSHTSDTGDGHYNDTGHTNAIIQQTVATEADQTYLLTFWYAPRDGETGSDSAGMDVLWNGQVVKSIDSTGVTAGVWQEITVVVTGTGGNNTLGFHGAGAEDSLGAYIDNVSLVAAPAGWVDEDGLPGGNADPAPGDVVLPTPETMTHGALGIQWGADNNDSATADTLGANGIYTQDTPAAHSRSVTFANTDVTVVGGTLTSHGDQVILALSADGTQLIGTADHDGDTRTVFTASLSDDGTGQFAFVLQDALDHAAGNHENDMSLSFNFTATDSDGDSAAGSFSVVVNDDTPVTVADTDSISEDGTAATGNVVTGAYVPFGGYTADTNGTDGSADKPGADGFKSIQWANQTSAHVIGGLYGSLHVDAAGNYAYVPGAGAQALAAGASVSDIFTYTLTDGDGDVSAPTTLTITVNNPDHAPVAVPDTFNAVPEGWTLDPNGSAHVYEFVPLANNTDWQDASNQIAGLLSGAEHSYLATITSDAENNTVLGVVSTAAGFNVIAYLGGSDAGQNGTWKWVTGPEAGQTFFVGDNTTGTTEPGFYTKWDPSDGGEPNNNGGDESILWFYGAFRNGTWNDAPITGGLPFGGYTFGAVAEAGEPGSLYAAIDEDHAANIPTALVLENDHDADNDPLTVTGVSATSAHGATVSLSGGAIHYDPTAAADIQSLGAGQSLIDTFTYTISDGHGGTDSTTVSLTVEGVNDAPAILSSDLGSIAEAGDLQPAVNEAGIGGPLSIGSPAAGLAQLVLAALDAHLPMPPLPPTSVPVVVTQQNIADAIDGVMSAASVDKGAAIAVVWQNMDSLYGSHGANDTNLNAGFLYLGLYYAAYVKAGGEPLLDVTAKYVADGSDLDTLPERMQSLHDNLLGNLTDYALHQRYDTAGLYSTMLGLVDAQDSALVTRTGQAVAGYENDPSGSTVADGHAFDLIHGYATHASGQLVANDPDTGDNTNLSWSVANGAGTYGTFSVDTAGKWTYVLDDARTATQNLGQGEYGTETFNVTVTDGHGGTTTQAVTITVDGTNDAPVITTAAGEASATLYASGALSDVVTADVASDHQFHFEEPGSGPRMDPALETTIANLITTNTNTSNDTMNMQAVLAGVQAVLGHAAGEADAIAAVWTYIDDVYTSSDGYYKTALNAVGVRLAIAYANYIKAGGEPLNDVIAKYHPDGADSGGVTDGIPDRSQSLHDNLLGAVDTPSIDDKFSSDPALLTILKSEIAAAGLTDRPIYSGDESGIQSDPTATIAWDETNGLLPGGTHQVVTGQLTATDVDDNDAGKLTWTTDQLGGTYGTFTLNAAGHWTYTLDDSLATTKALSATDVVTDSFTATVADAHGGSASETVSVTVHGTNDAPTLDLDGTTDGTGYETSFTAGGNAVAIAGADTVIGDVDSPMMSKAVIVLTNAQIGDVLSVGQLSSGMSFTTDTSVAGRITVTISGPGTLANYDAAIESVKFSTSGSSSADRWLTVAVDDDHGATSNTATSIIHSAGSTIDVSDGPHGLQFAWNGNSNFSHPHNNGTVTGFDIIPNYDSVTKLMFPTVPTLGANASATTAHNASYLDYDNGTGHAIVTHSILNGVVTFYSDTNGSDPITLANDQNHNGVAAAVDYLVRNDLGDAGATVVFNVGSDSYVFEQGAATPHLTDPAAAPTDDATDTLVKLTGQSNPLAIAAEIGAGLKIDPIILDLDGNGVHLNTAASFDLANNGEASTFAWPGPHDGILVADLDHSGTIQNGGDVFSPSFGGGDYATSLDALKTYDSNGDGKISADDAKFGDIGVWVDANGNGVSDAGEVHSLSDLGIAGIDLGANEVDFDIDGQHVFAQGTFELSNGETSDYVGVDLGAPLPDLTGGDPTAADAGTGVPPEVTGDIHTGTAGADNFALTDLHAVDFIADYNFGQGDTVDLSALLGHNSGANAANAADYVKVEGNTIAVDTSGSGHDFVDVAVLNHPVPDVKVILDDGVDVTVNHLG